MVTLVEQYRQRFGTDPAGVACAPGRVNLLGEHVDYNDGFVLPAAIDRATWLAFGPSQAGGPGDGQTTLLAADLGEEAVFTPQSLAAGQDVAGAPLPAWARYPAGMQWALAQAGLAAPGMRGVYQSTVPPGSGLSSSASIELAFGVAWQKLGGWSLPPLELAKLGKLAENQYVGVNCGIMDQFASACGAADHLLWLDCRSLEWRTVGIPQDVAIVVADTTVRRRLTDGAYNERRADCEAAVRQLAQFLPGIASLRDVALADFNALADRLPERVQRRARHVVEEIARTQAALPLLEAGDLAGFGALMNACHASLRDLYNVSIPELDTMVGLAQTLPGCYGARLTGAGFGGCTVNLVAHAQAEAFSRALAAGYTAETGLTPEIYICHASAGAALVDGGV